MICVSISDMSGLQEAIQAGAELLELRLDLIDEHPSRLFPLVSGKAEILIACRPGVYKESKRIELLLAGMKLGADYVDIEIETGAGDLELLLDAAAQSGTTVIISYHNFNKTLERIELEALMLTCYEKGGEIAKIACQVNTSEDIRNLLSLYSLPGKKIILGMGPEGRITRVTGPYLGAEFTFASIDEEEETAPGQLSVKQLNLIYKVIDEA